GDGFEDLIVASSGDDRLRFLAGAADGEFVLAGELELPSRPVAVCARDLDLDGDLDIVVSTGEADGTNTHLLVIEGDGSLSPSLVLDIPLPGVAPFLDAGDLDGDGRPEIVVSQTGLSQGELFLGSSTSGLDFTLSGVSVGQGPGYVSLRDADEDGSLELLVALAVGELALLEDDGAGGLAPVAGATNGGRFPLPVGASAAELCEATGDDLLDLLVVSPDSGFLWVAASESV
ncbi:MAG: VCBS repeat-containing protein, partial [Proteobacteria bacterium]|nr:VCBS repeat-containing protein [Pseudomonadota bacterium]